eukprot:gene14752-16917_t
MSRSVGRDQKGAKVGQKGGKDFKSKRGIDMSELVNFRYERPVAVQSTPHRSGRKSYNRDSTHHVSKAQFVQANFRFLLSPLTNPLDPCLYDPDVIVPWQYVACVILPSKRHSYGQSRSLPSWEAGSSPTITADDFEPTESTSEFEACPICLEDVQVPRITSCGHTFCYTCILRHLQSDLRNCDKCPICAVSLCLSDLKTVLHATDNLKHIFASLGSTAAVGHGVETKRHRSGSIDSTSSTTYTHRTDLMGQDVDFTLLQMTKGSIVPQKANSDGSVCSLTQNHHSNGPESGKLTLSSVLSDCTADCAVYNRLMYLTQEHMRQLFAHDREVLQQFRQLCLPAPSNINNLHKTNTTISNTTDSNFPPLGGNVWAAKSTTNSSNKPPLNNTSSSIKPSSPVGDVEALPFIQLALERQQQLEKEFENKLTQKALVNSLMMDAPVRSSSNQDPFASANNPSDTTENTITNKLHYHVYQHASGSLVFMHPICAKCILETSVHAGIEPNTGENDVAHSIVPQRLSPRTQLQKKLAPQSSAKPTTVNTTGTAATSVNFTTTGSDTTPADDVSPRTPSTPIAASTAITLPLHLHTTLRARVIDAECVRVTTDTRARYNVLRHLPLHSEVMLLEIDLAGIVPQHILCKYSEELNKRALRRKERAKQEKREKRLEQDRSMAEALLAQEHHDYLMQIREMELLQLDELHHGPTVREMSGAGVSDSYNHVDSAINIPVITGELPSNGHPGDESADTSAVVQDTADGSHSAQQKVFSFANITQMGGNFPSLAASSASKKPTQSVSTNAWGQPQPQSKNNTNHSTSAINSSSAISKTGMEKATWERGSKAPLSGEKNSSAWPTATSSNKSYGDSGASGVNAAVFAPVADNGGSLAL